jgi:hypothetical protein
MALGDNKEEVRMIVLGKGDGGGGMCLEGGGCGCCVGGMGVG